MGESGTSYRYLVLPKPAGLVLPKPAGLALPKPAGLVLTALLLLICQQGHAQTNVAMDIGQTQVAPKTQLAAETPVQYQVQRQAAAPANMTIAAKEAVGAQPVQTQVIPQTQPQAHIKPQPQLQSQAQPKDQAYTQTVIHNHPAVSTPQKAAAAVQNSSPQKAPIRTQVYSLNDGLGVSVPNRPQAQMPVQTAAQAIQPSQLIQPIKHGQSVGLASATQGAAETQTHIKPVQESLPLGHSAKDGVASAAQPAPQTAQTGSQDSSGNWSDALSFAKSGGWINTMFALGIVLMLILLLKAMFQKSRGSSLGKRNPGAVEVLSRTNVSQKNNVLLMRVGGKVLVVAEGVSGLSTLSEVSEPRELATLMIQAGKSSKSAREFSQMLSELESSSDTLIREGGQVAAPEALPQQSSLLSKIGAGLGLGGSRQNVNPAQIYPLQQSYQQVQAQAQAAQQQVNMQRAVQTRDQVQLSSSRQAQRLGPQIGTGSPGKPSRGATLPPKVAKSGRSPEEIQKMLAKVRAASKENQTSQTQADPQTHINHAA